METFLYPFRLRILSTLRSGELGVEETKSIPYLDPDRPSSLDQDWIHFSKKQVFLVFIISPKDYNQTTTINFKYSRRET